METKLKQLYEAPSTMVLEVKSEGVICVSGQQMIWIGSWIGAGDPVNVNGLSDYAWHNEFAE